MCSAETVLLLAILRSDKGLDVRAGNTSGTHMLESFSGLGSSKEERVGARGVLHDELVEGQALATGGGDASAGGLGESESGDGQTLGDFEDSLVIGDGGDDNNGSGSINATKLGLRRGTYWLEPRCFTNLEIETGGLLVLDATRRLRTVLTKAESVLLARNLKSFTRR